MTQERIAFFPAPAARSARSAVAATAFCMAIALPAAAATVEFDVKGAAATDPTAINAKGTITGSYEDSSFATHGFVRAADGNIKSFDAAGAIATLPNAISNKGAIAGDYANFAVLVSGLCPQREHDHIFRSIGIDRDICHGRQ